ncbi:hypothetical protein [Actinomadura macrotermitis]|uniref:Uncharacterized protein n=1 Tax=Actinomadura macrotermitis TaxID=2585200 RepID=A0A7K0BV17_9ACTN|nr:hypothetical protein [Actinomadura macrotermitis]MQY05029.1 hypothetical protein [Actinomadura macrotermitis]
MNQPTLSTETTPRACHERLLVLDHHPWYEAPPRYEDRVRGLLGGWYPHVLGHTELAGLTAETLAPVIRPGDVVVAPLMSGALLLPVLRRLCDEAGAHLLLLPMSKHPFVTLSADPPEALQAACTDYARSSAGLSDLPAVLRRLTGRSTRVIFADSNSATGRDALLFRELCTDWLGRAPDYAFAVLVNEIGVDEDTAPGWRSGRKALRPDRSGIVLSGSTTRYLSHLRFLTRTWEEQVDTARAVRAAHPELTAYWDTISEQLRYIHGHRASTLAIHRERLHVRTAQDEDEATTAAVHAALTGLDAAAPLRPRDPGERGPLLRHWTTALAGDVV